MSLCDKKNTMMVLAEFLKLLLKQVSLGHSDESIFVVQHFSSERDLKYTMLSSDK